MPEVTFHYNVSDRLQYACRLLRKAYRSGTPVAVLGDGDLLDRLDRLLWIFDDLEFIPHLRVQPGQPVAAHLAATPIWLVESLDALPPGLTVLVQLAHDLPAGLERFERIHEIVSAEPEQAQAGRQRWRAHAQAGRSIVPSDASRPA